MSNEKILISFVYQEGNRFVLVVPDLGSKLMVVAKSRSEVVRKAIRQIRDKFKNEIIDMTPSSAEIYTDEYKNKKGIPNDAMLFLLPIKVGKRIKKFKRFTSSMDETLFDEIEFFCKKRNIKKSDLFAQATREYMQKYDIHSLNK